MAQQMLKHKVTGELFVYTALLAQLPELELVQEDPVEVALNAIAAEAAVEAAVAPAVQPQKKQRKNMFSQV